MAHGQVVVYYPPAVVAPAPVVVQPSYVAAPTVVARVPVAAAPEAWGDFIVGRKETPTSYHLSVVLDDAAQGVTDVVRGMDLFNATSLHRLLQELLELPAPNYHHHELILDDEGKKLSKSTHATSIRSLREAGESAESVRARVGF